MLTHPTLDLLHDLGLHGMAKGFKALEQYIKPVFSLSRCQSSSSPLTDAPSIHCQAMFMASRAGSRLPSSGGAAANTLSATAR